MAQNKIQPIRGMQSLVGEEADRMHSVVTAFERVRALFGFKRVQVPVLEPTPVFARTMGETTDVVSKEMYTFQDRNDEWVTMRPEFTAGICRAYLTEGWQRFAPLKAASHGPVFRYERPQKGRFRQFHQVDAEIIGSADPAADVELLTFADHLLRELGIAETVSLQLNTLGDNESRDAWRSALLDFFSSHRSSLSEESLNRLRQNPLRILDSKDPRDREVAIHAPKIDRYLSTEAAEFFSQVTSGLDEARVKWVRNDGLVRGLDYYRHTAFEFVTDRLGAQGAVLAGGRYDGLIEALGGSHTPAVGWAAGIERLAMLVDPNSKPSRTAALVVESDELALQNIGKMMMRALRSGGMPTQIVADGSVRKRFQRAAALEPDYLLVLLESGDPEAVGIFRVKRRIIDRFRTRGTVFKSLKLLLQNQFGVPSDKYREITRRGGEVILLRQPK